MRNMGRLFQYNRFGGNEENAEDNKKDIPSQGGAKNRELQQQFGANCPAYAELYPDYACTVSRTEATATPTVATTTAMPPTMTTTPTAVATTMTSRSIDLALRKYQQWSSKFLTTTNNNSNTLCATEKHTTTMPTLPVATNADSVTHLSTSSSQKSNSCSHSQSQSQSHSCSYSTSSGYYSRTMVASGAEKLTWHEHQHGWRADGEGDRELLVSASKRPKVYDCMKDFLRRKLFQQRHEPQQEREQQLEKQQNYLTAHCKSDTEEDVTSDYDEVDILDSSYNADEEDASDCSSQCTYPLESDTEEATSAHELQQDRKSSVQSTTPQKSISPQKSMLSLNCWQNITQYTDSTTEPEEDDTEDVADWRATQKTAADDDDYQHIAAEDSDAGISDCCQLISDKTSPAKQRKRKQQQKHKQKQKQKQEKSPRYNLSSANDEVELLASSWYQPRITTKAALERLLPAAPGTFLLRRKSRTYELCLRAETKVKHFAVVSLADNHYKLKGAKKQFTSLKALVTHHSVMAEQLPLTLALPREYESNKAYSGKWAEAQAAAMNVVSARTLRSLRYADDFDTYESLQILGLLQDWQCEANEF